MPELVLDEMRKADFVVDIREYWGENVDDALLESLGFRSDGRRVDRPGAAIGSGGKGIGRCREAELGAFRTNRAGGAGATASALSGEMTCPRLIADGRQTGKAAGHGCSAKSAV